MTTALAVRGLSVRFGGHVAVDDVSIEVESGTVTGLIGPNGAGKTSLFNAASGLVPADAGRVELEGVDITARAPHERARLGLARTFQRLELFTSLTVAENLQVAGEIRNVWSDDQMNVRSEAERVTGLLGLRAVADRSVAEIPTGQARAVEVGRALMTRPRVLLLDEPASGQNEIETEAFGRLLRRLLGDGITIFVVEHDMSLVMAVCDFIHVLDFGVVIARGAPAEVQTNPAVLDAYLGRGA